jgi:hypothetical protein
MRAARQFQTSMRFQAPRLSSPSPLHFKRSPVSWVTKKIMASSCFSAHGAVLSSKSDLESDVVVDRSSRRWADAESYIRKRVAATRRHSQCHVTCARLPNAAAFVRDAVSAHYPAKIFHNSGSLSAIASHWWRLRCPGTSGAEANETRCSAMRDKVLTEAETAEILGCKVKTLRSSPIPYSYLHPRTRRYKRYRFADIEVWITQSLQTGNVECHSTRGRVRRTFGVSSRSMGRGFAAALAAHPAEKEKRMNVGLERKPSPCWWVIPVF